MKHVGYKEYRENFSCCSVWRREGNGTVHAQVVSRHFVCTFWGGGHATCANWVDNTRAYVYSAMVNMYLLGVINDVIIEQGEATCSSCDCLLGHKAKYLFKGTKNTKA